MDDALAELCKPRKQRGGGFRSGVRSALLKEKEAESDSSKEAESDSSDDEPLSKRLQLRDTLKEAKTPKSGQGQRPEGAAASLGPCELGVPQYGVFSRIASCILTYSRCILPTGLQYMCCYVYCNCIVVHSLCILPNTQEYIGLMMYCR